jgi:putative ABC transport system substrate-binding protein
MSFSMFALVAKQVELLAEIVPGMSRIAMLTGTFDPPKDSPYYGRPDAWEVAARQAAAAKGLALVLVRADDSANLREAFATLKRERAEGLVMATNALVTRMHSEVIAEIQRLRMPAISGYAAFAGAGGLLSYGGNFLETNRYAAKFVDLILKGAVPSDLPVEQISKYELVVNQKSARELGLKVPQSILVRADRVIE